ncbi:MAG: right-handed parallel beta-helix repeat-containing protein, partial [Bacteroidota bacterium]|nr:right-handed parallel beta-helix repeat-containing protein [Bacteroidota bacterium]
MKKILQLLTLLALVVLLIGTGIPSYALDVFVSTSEQLRVACQNAASGHTIILTGDNYTGPFILENKTGVTLRSQNNKSVLLKGNPDPSTSGINILTIKNSSNILVHRLKFTENWGNGGNGIVVTGSGSGVTISKCELSYIGWTKDNEAEPEPSQNAHAIVVRGSMATPYTNIVVRNNTIHHCITGYSESLTLTGNVSGFRIENNNLHHNTNIGIDCAGHYSTGAPADVNYARNGVIRLNMVYDFDGPDSLPAAAGIYVDGGSSIIIERNWVYNYKVGISIGCENDNKKSRNNIVRNNRISNATESGITPSLSGIFVGSSNPTSLVENTRVTNNTLYKNGYGLYDNGQIGLFNNSGTIIKNNILYPADGRYALVQMSGATSTNLNISHNLYYRDNRNVENLYYEIPEDKTGDNTAIKKNPLFVSAPTNYHLSGNSPAFNAGDPAFTALGELDIDGHTRILNGRVDVGFDELTPPTRPSGLTLGPILANDIFLRWRDNSNNESGFKVERSRGTSTNYTQIATVGGTTYRDAGLFNFTRYNYRIRAYNQAGNSAYTPVVSGTTTGFKLAASNLDNAENVAAFEVSLYPNPISNNTATILLKLAKDSKVKMSVYDLAGRRVANLLENKVLTKGITSLNFNAPHYNLQSGIYL